MSIILRTIKGIPLTHIELDGNFIDLDGRVNIFETGPTNFIVGNNLPAIQDGTVHVHTENAGIVTANVDGDDIVIENNANAGISVLAPDANFSSVKLGSPSEANGSFIVWGYDSGYLTLATNKSGAGIRLATDLATIAVQILSNGNVGIKTLTPDGTLHVHTLSAGTVTANADGDDLIVENDTNGGISILTPDANFANLMFGSPSDEIGAYVQWSYDSNFMRVATQNIGADLVLASGNGVEAIRVDSSQKVGIGTSTPASILDVKGILTLSGVATATLKTTDASGLYIDASTAGGMYIQSDGQIIIRGSAGLGYSEHVRITSTGGIYTAGATGGDQGAGTINAVAVYDDSVLLTCYVPHFIVDGKLNIEDWDSWAPQATHEPARKFLANLSDRIDVKNFTNYWKTYKHLPTMPSKDEWIEGEKKSLGDLVQRLWETVELQSAHIDQLLTRLEKLEAA